MNLRNGKRILFVLIIAASIIGSCSLPADDHFAKNMLNTLAAIKTRTEYPTQTPYATQAPYPTDTLAPSPLAKKTATELALIQKPIDIPQTPTPYPTQTAYPTVVEEYQLPVRNEIILLPGIWQRDLRQYGRCNDIFEVKLGYRAPYFVYAIGNEVSKKQWMIVDIFIYTTSDVTIPSINHKQFKVRGTLNGEQVEYASNRSGGQSAADRWGVHYVGGAPLVPGIEYETYLGFDVDHKAKDWHLIFKSDEGNGLDCFFSIPLPPVDFGINYLETLQSKQANP